MLRAAADPGERLRAGLGTCSQAAACQAKRLGVRIALDGIDSAFELLRRDKSNPDVTYQRCASGSGSDALLSLYQLDGTRTPWGEQNRVLRRTWVARTPFPLPDVRY